MSARPFLDTNVLVYAFAADNPRSLVAGELLAAGRTVSVQILSELVNISRRRLGRGWEEIAGMLEVVRTLLGEAVPLTAETHARALEIARTAGLAFHDGMIVAAAQLARCPILYSEDMQDGRMIGAVRIVNPFAAGRQA